jgi:YggT family protein
VALSRIGARRPRHDPDGVAAAAGRQGPLVWGRATRYMFPSSLRTESTMLELLRFISYLLTLYIYILIASAVMSWLIVFNVVNPSNPFVHMVGEFLYRVTEPVLRPIRNMLPNLGGIDISPIVVILIIIFIQEVILPNLARAFGY